MKRITIEDVARKAGVSKQTVSRVLNEKPDVAPKTRAYIKTLIKSMGYIPDPIARSMKGKTQTLGCIAPNLSDYNFSCIIDAAQREAQQNGYFILAGSAPSEFDVPSLLTEMMNRRVDGLMVINPRNDQRYRHFLPLIEAKLPMVYINNTPVDEPVSAVGLDDLVGGYMAVHHLLSLGHKEIVTILGPEIEECTRERLIGYQKALNENGIAIDQRWIVNGDWSSQSGYSAIKKLLSYRVHFTAIFAQNDRMALGAMHALHEENINIPENISIIGYDLPMTAYFNPSLTSIQQPLAKLGQIGAQYLIEAVHNPDLPPQVTRLAPTLINRQSCTHPHMYKEMRNQ